MHGYFFSLGDNIRYRTVGRPKRKRKPGAGNAVRVSSHLRTPRGPNRGKSKVRVDGYKRGAGRRKKRGRKR